MSSLNVKGPEDLITNMLHNLYKEHKRAMRIIYPSPDYDIKYNEEIGKLDEDLQGHLSRLNSVLEETTKLDHHEGGKKRITRRLKKYNNFR